MSEFMEPHSVSKLIGSPPGYVGYGDRSIICDFIKNNPYSLLLLDLKIVLLYLPVILVLNYLIRMLLALEALR